MLKKIGLVVLVLSFCLAGVSVNAAGLTLGAGTVAGTTTLDLSGAVGSAITLGATTTTGAIGIGAALTTGAITLGNNSQTSATTIYGGGTGSASAVNAVNITGTLAGTTTGESHGLNVVTTGTTGAGGNLVGVNSVLTASGAAGLWESAVYGKVVQPAGQALAGGYISGGEFEVNNANTGAMNEMFPLVLDSNNAAASYHPTSAYIWVQDFGTAKMPNLFNITGATIGAGNMVQTAAKSGVVSTHSLRIQINGTAYYIPMSTTQTFN